MAVHCLLIAGPASRAEAASALARTSKAEQAHDAAPQYAQPKKELEALEHCLPKRFAMNQPPGLAYSARGRHQKVVPFMTKAGRPGPAFPQSNTLLVANLNQSQTGSDEEKILRGAVEQAPQDFEANRTLGEFYLRQGKLREAIPYLERAQKSNPSSYENGYNLALACLQVRDYPAARRQIKALLQLRETAELHSLLGEAEEKAGNPAKATQEFARAAQMNPSEDNLINLGIEFARYHALDLAEKVFVGGAERYPRSARMQVGLGYCNYLREKYGRARAAFVRAAELAPSNGNVYLALAKAYTSAPEMHGTGISALMRKWARLKPNDPRASYYCALSLRKEAHDLGREANPAAIEPLLKTAVRLDPRMAGPYLQLGILRFEAHRYTEAIRMYERAIKLQPDLSEAHYRLGQALARAGEKARASQESKLYGRLRKKEDLERAKKDAEMLELIYPGETGSDIGPSGDGAN
ncbi:MAG TPA: tetratricopeptide repeat protein [Terriglobia bacterium]|nr:tetratricopeptide repeat protein [Terriglobia bacterium]